MPSYIWEELKYLGVSCSKTQVLGELMWTMNTLYFYFGLLTIFFVVTDRSSKENSIIFFDNGSSSAYSEDDSDFSAVISEVEGGGLVFVAYVWRNTP